MASASQAEGPGQASDRSEALVALVQRLRLAAGDELATAKQVHAKENQSSLVEFIEQRCKVVTEISEATAIAKIQKDMVAFATELGKAQHIEITKATNKNTKLGKKHVLKATDAFY